MIPDKTPWPPEQSGLALALYRDGKSDSEIAAALLAEFGVRRTRSAIQGKIFRLAGKPQKRAPAPKLKARVEPSTWQSTPPKPITGWPVTDGAVGLVHLAPSACRFPVGEATGADQLFCGAPAVPGHVYCATCRPRTITRTLFPIMGRIAA